MNPNDIEIEIKLPLKNPEEVIAFLQKKAKLLAKNTHQKDIYYTPKHRDFLATKYPYEWLRLRHSSKGNCITYKHYYPENTKVTDYCDEFESSLDNISVLEKILTSLDFKTLAVVDKNRSTWDYKQVEVAIDEVKDLGSFIELEAKRQFPTPQAAKEYLYEILEELHAQVGKEELRGYPYLLLAKKGYQFGE
ncbi:class IV adenylate cyclase [Candidatus Beckwithbacteria bacterium]|nr:class IV adenylate cyclase [Candidatus Beckwithbacteria bacterium]